VCALDVGCCNDEVTWDDLCAAIAVESCDLECEICTPDSVRACACMPGVGGTQLCEADLGTMSFDPSIS